MNQTPTLGRIVLFVTPGGIVCPAVVTRVWDPSCVNLHVMQDHEPAYSETSVFFDRDLAKARTWCWPDKVRAEAKEGRHWYVASVSRGAGSGQDPNNAFGFSRVNWGLLKPGDILIVCDEKTPL